MMYYEGLGVPKLREKAFALFEEASLVGALLSLHLNTFSSPCPDRVAISQLRTMWPSVWKMGLESRGMSLQLWRSTNTLLTEAMPKPAMAMGISS
jgi:TPR repeat protein